MQRILRNENEVSGSDLPCLITHPNSPSPSITIRLGVKFAAFSRAGRDVDRVHFKSYGDFALNFEIVYYVQVPHYNVYMDIQQAINLAIFRRFQEEGIEFAYPTQTVYVEKD
jgi:small-conductance mechanosensitive channel